jgi:hypothetical protein
MYTHRIEVLLRTNGEHAVPKMCHLHMTTCTNEKAPSIEYENLYHSPSRSLKRRLQMRKVCREWSSRSRLWWEKARCVTVCLNSANRRCDSLGHKQVLGLKLIENTIQEATVHASTRTSLLTPADIRNSDEDQPKSDDVSLSQRTSHWV